jgi:hypothetical protein
MRRQSRIVIGTYYWYLEQDNEKMNNGQLVCTEKGMERFTKNDFDSTVIVKWWRANERTWCLIATEWNEIKRNKKSIKLEGSLMVNDYQKNVFTFVRELNASNKSDKEARKAIRQFIKKNCQIS